MVPNLSLKLSMQKQCVRQRVKSQDVHTEVLEKLEYNIKYTIANI